jgi:phenylalanyl-tRNA synthetase beta chain
MKVSYNWLKEFVEIPETPPQLAARLTNLGFAVDALEVHGGDSLFELDIATNRPDCLSHWGLAREIAASYGTALKPPTFTLKESEKHAKDVFSISIADDDLCARYCGRCIQGVKIGPSPDWLKSRLEALGVRSINNVADITNYVMLELGQPLHAFDADTIEGQTIIVRRAAFEEKITTLDGIERELNPSMLVIADAKRAVAVAGVMGGGETEISPSTKNVLLESANFDPLSIRKTSRSLGLSSEASYRFERGADVEMARFACDRAATLIEVVAGGRIYREVIDVYPRPCQFVTVKLRRKRIESFLGAEVPDSTAEYIFEKLAFKVNRIHEGWNVEIPSHRMDVTREEDLLEEIARHYGFDKFPATLPAWSGFGAGLPHESAERLLRNHLASAGYSETIPIVFSDELAERKFRPDVEPVRLRNPMAENEAILRTSQIPSMLRTIEWNLNRGTRHLQLYELGKIYKSGGESRALILTATGSLRTKTVHESEREFNFFDLKGDVEGILSAFNIQLRSSGDSLPAYYHPGRAGRDDDLVTFGELHPDYAGEYKFRQRIYIAEFDVELMFASKGSQLIEAIPKFPSIRRDFSLLLNKSTRYAEVEQAVRVANIAEIVRIEPFDRLDSGPFSESKYALAISVTYQSSERTLTDDEVDNFDKAILNSLKQRLGAELRQQV